MSKYLSNRKRKIQVGISSYTDSSTVLEVTGRVGINTSNAQTELSVQGSADISDDLTASNISVSGIITAREYYGDGSTLTNVLSDKLSELNHN